MGLATLDPSYGLIRNEADFARHVEYCYVNPVKHGFVTRVRDRPIRRFIATSSGGFSRSIARAMAQQTANW